MSNADISKRCGYAIPNGVGMLTQAYMDCAETYETWDVEGTHYIDFAASIAVVNTGHHHKKMMTEIEPRLADFSHTCHQALPQGALWLSHLVVGSTDARSWG